MRAAHRASVPMFVLCGLAVLAGVLALLASAVPLDQLPPDKQQQLAQMFAGTHWSVKSYFLCTGCVMSGMGLVLGALALLVRGGRLWATVAAVVVNGLIGLCLGIAILEAVLGPQATGLAGALPAVGMMMLVVFTITRLGAAVRAVRQFRSLATQFQTQDWDYDPANPAGGYSAGPWPPADESGPPRQQ